MAVRQCKECGKDVGSKVRKCPHCGTDQRGFLARHPIMTAFGGLILFGMVMASIAPNPPAGTNTSESLQTEQIQPVTKSYRIGENIEVGNFAYKVKSINFYKTIGNEFTKKTADGEFLVVTMDITNKDKEARMIDSNLFKIKDSTNTEYSASTEGNTALQLSGKNTLFLKNCNPNITTSGIVAFEVPNRNEKYNIDLSGGFWSGETAQVALN